jgi:LysM repeat protein
LRNTDLARNAIREILPQVSKRNRSPLFFAVIGLTLLAIIIVVLISRAGRDSSPDQLRELETRVKRLEQKLIKLEVIEVRLAQLEDKWKDSTMLVMDRIDRLEKTMTQVKDLKGEDPKDVRPKSAEAGQKTPDAAKPSDTQKKRAEPTYHQVRDGETLYRISRTYGLSVDDLLRLNHLPPGAAIRPGQKLLVGPAEGR